MKCLGQYKEEDRICELCEKVYPDEYRKCVNQVVEVDLENTVGRFTRFISETYYYKFIGIGDYGNVWLLTEYFREMEDIFRDVHQMFGVQSIILDASSNYYVRDTNGHESGSHSEGNAIDIIYYGLESGQLMAKAMLYLFQRMEKRFTELYILVGESVKAALEKEAGKKLNYIHIYGGSHKFDKTKWYSHAHCGFQLHLGGHIKTQSA